MRSGRVVVYVTFPGDAADLDVDVLTFQPSGLCTFQLLHLFLCTDFPALIPFHIQLLAPLHLLAQI